MTRPARRKPDPKWPGPGAAASCHGLTQGLLSCKFLQPPQLWYPVLRARSPPYLAGAQISATALAFLLHTSSSTHENFLGTPGSPVTPRTPGTPRDPGDPGNPEGHFGHDPTGKAPWWKNGPRWPPHGLKNALRKAQIAPKSPP